MNRLAQRGAVTPFALLAAAAMLCAAMALAIIGGALAAQRRVEAAADLAALAAAKAIQHGVGGCAAAARSATRNDARLTACTVDGPDVTVTVTRDAPVMFGRRLTVRALARAGPL